MAEDERSMRDIMEEVYDRMTADDPPEESAPTSVVFTGAEDSEEARDRAARYKTMSDVWEKYNGPEAEKWAQAEAPATWSREARQKFADLPPDAKKMVLTEWQSSKGGSYGSGRWAQYLHRQGVSADQAFNKMMELEHTLRFGSPEEKRSLAAYMLTSYGLNAGVQGAQSARGAQMQRRHAFGRLMDRLEAASDAGGKKTYPQARQVRQAMARIMGGNSGLTFREAYRRVADGRAGGAVADGGQSIRDTLEETYDRIMARESAHGRKRFK